MSQRLIDLNPDLKRLRDEGYSVEVRNGFVLLLEVPYVTEAGTVDHGTLVSNLHMAGDRTIAPDTHVVHFSGGQPCRKNGSPITQILHQAQQTQLAPNIVVDRSFSNKPPEGYRDYHHKMSTYADIISGPAFSIDQNNTAKKYLPVSARAEESVFHYFDTASSRAGISSLGAKLELNKVAIIGLGGTGSYIFDHVAKTPVREIHLFDPDRFHSHNAFRAPGAASISELEAQSFKVDYLAAIYSKMRRGIVAHQAAVTADSGELLAGTQFAFVCIDGGKAKRIVLELLTQLQIPFIDCGIGLERVDDKLTGQIRVTSGSPGLDKHIWERNAVAFSDAEGGNEYSWNIQLSDLNALNAALAVIKWKKWAGFYVDLEHEMHSVYPIDGNILINEYCNAQV